MGYRGKVDAQRRACELRATGRTLADIAAELGVAKSSVGLWVRDVEFEPRPRRRARRRGPNVLQRRKADEMEAKFRELERQMGGGKSGGAPDSPDVEDELAALKKRIRV